ncbi:hypothetical protein GUJ93_ZPchr0010g9233 [Zizania palustris]|uniref:Uncharacterized protein n=1 Tax=Zizania palustris TaxID=103762 RepID=A0A8J5WD42_ZIZPA|nr:hypothetical protein GUJ93_ZPchr0010g9233 [Zizania palustris]
MEMERLPEFQCAAPPHHTTTVPTPHRGKRTLAYLPRRGHSLQLVSWSSAHGILARRRCGAGHELLWPT